MLSSLRRSLPRRPWANLNHRRTYMKNLAAYEALHEHSTDPTRLSSFWDNAAKDIDWFEPFKHVMDDSGSPFTKWFVGGTTNMCFNAVDRHVLQGRQHDVAIEYDSPVSGLRSTMTFGDLHEAVIKCSHVLKERGVGKGDRVIIYMPMIPEAAVAMLACARIGAIHSVVFGGFAATELSVRIDHAKPAAVLSATNGFEPGRMVDYEPLLRDALNLAKHKPDVVILKNRHNEHRLLQDEWQDWDEAMGQVPDTANTLPCEHMASTDPLYILYTSGTTGQPKGVIRDTGGYCTALRWSMEHFMDMPPNRTDDGAYWAASDIGWVVGHSYCVYGPLLNGNTTVLFEGKPIGTPDAATYWRIVEEHRVRTMFTAPTALRAIRRDDPHLNMAGRYDLSSLRTLFIAGERGDPETVHYFNEKLNIPVVDHYWQTETGWPICGIQCSSIGNKLGSSSKPLPGYSVKALNPKTSEPLAPRQLGDLVVKLPLPPGTLQTLYQDDKRFEEAYMDKHKGYYLTGDAGYIDEDGYVFIMSRTDDVINTAGHRLSTGAMEEVLLAHDAIGDCAVVGLKDTLKGELPLGFIVLNKGIKESSHERVKQELVNCVREQIGPVAAFKRVIIVQQLPKTRSGKTLRNVLHSLVNGEDYTLPGTIEDARVMDHIQLAVSSETFNT